MSDSTTKSLQARLATAQECREALAIVFAHLTLEQRERQIDAALAQAGAGPLDGLWLGLDGDQLVAAMLAQPQSGRTAVVMPPRVVAGQPSQLAARLGQIVLGRLHEQGVQLAQALLETDTGADAELLRQLSFVHVSNLLYLVSMAGQFPSSAPQDGLEFSAFGDADQKRLESLVERTYHGSLDCPQVDGVRAMSDVLEGYKATGAYDPRRWVIARLGQQDIGCVLLTAHPQHRQWELIYMGVVPEARGHGLGVAITRHAQWMARGDQAERLVLAVDANNAPAIAMYAACGFTSWDHRSVFLRQF